MFASVVFADMKYIPEQCDALDDEVNDFAYTISVLEPCLVKYAIWSSSSSPNFLPPVPLATAAMPLPPALAPIEAPMTMSIRRTLRATATAMAVIDKHE